MKPNFPTVIFLLFLFQINAQYEYEPSDQHPSGIPNPEAPQQLKDFAPMIGNCSCISVSRNQDQNWADPVDMQWKFKYIMNGMAIQDETLTADGKHSGSIRQFNKDSLKWYVHYYASASPRPTLSSWEGGLKDGKIILYREQKAPNGTEGFYRITIYDIDQAGFKWLGEWVNKDETFVYPTWKIECTKVDSK